MCPIAIKYNKIFAETFWHSRRQSFTQHLFTLMTSWAVVADVWYLEPQEMQPGEDGIQFAERWGNPAQFDQCETVYTAVDPAQVTDVNASPSFYSL